MTDIIPITFFLLIILFLCTYSIEKIHLFSKFQVNYSCLMPEAFEAGVVHLMTQVIPHIEWRGWADMLAVGAYLSGIVPLLSITLLEFGVLKRNATDRERTHSHFLYLIGFLVVSHIAMIFGMVDPAVTGWQSDMQQVQQEAHMHAPSPEPDPMSSSTAGHAHHH